MIGPIFRPSSLARANSACTPTLCVLLSPDQWLPLPEVVLLAFAMPGAIPRALSPAFIAPVLCDSVS